MNIAVNAASHRISQKRAALAAVLLCGTMVSLPGWKIPGLRCAQPAPAMPAAYNWNNGASFWNAPVATVKIQPPNPVGLGDDEIKANDDDASADDSSVAPVKSKEEDAAQLNVPTDRKTFASFIKSASFLNLAKSDETDDKIKALEDSANEAIDPGPASSPDSNDKLLMPTVDPSTSDPYGGFIDVNSGPSIVNFDGNCFENSGQLPQSVFFNDPYLLSLISEALVGNQELRILKEEIQIARNETYARSGEYRPFVTLGAGAGVEKSGRHTRGGAVEEQLEVAPGRDFPDPLPDFLVGANVSWEIDIWNRLRNAQRSAAMRYLGTQEGRNFTVTRLVAEVAESYYRLLALDTRLLTLDQTIEIQQQSLSIAEAKKQAGRGTELAVQRFQAEVKKNQSERSLIEQEIVEVENRINFLAGRYPQRVERISGDFVDLNLNTLSAGVPSQLLQNRADIREAERQVAAAGLDVKVARARFYPALTLTGGLGWNAFATGYLFRTPESLVYSLAGDIVGPLINKRAIKADYASANAAQLQTIYNYQQTVLEAHIEVVNQISKVENLRRSIEVKKQQLAALEASVDSANKLFQNARAEYVEVLLAQREMMEARMVLIDTKREQLSAIVNAYQALGGGSF